MEVTLGIHTGIVSEPFCSVASFFVILLVWADPFDVHSCNCFVFLPVMFNTYFYTLFSVLLGAFGLAGSIISWKLFLC